MHESNSRWRNNNLTSLLGSVQYVQGGRVLQDCWCGYKPARVAIWRTAPRCLLIQFFISRHYVEIAWCTAGNRGPKSAHGVLGWLGRSSCFRNQIIPSWVPPRNRKVWVCERCSHSAAIIWCSVVNAGTWNGVYSVCTLPITVSSAERSFSKLKLIKSYLRSSIAQDRLDSLALISIENEAARQLDLDELVDKFANIKARKKEFWVL